LTGQALSEFKMAVLYCLAYAIISTLKEVQRNDKPSTPRRKDG